MTDTAEERLPIVLKNGTLKDPVTGHFLTGPTEPPITSSNASAMARRRHENAAIAARKALADIAERRGAGRSSVAAVGLLAGRAFEGAMAGFEGEKVELADGGSYNRRDLRGGKEAAKLALQLAQMLPADERAAAVVPVNGLAVSGDGVEFLRELVRGQAPALIEVVEGQAREVEE